LTIVPPANGPQEAPVDIDRLMEFSGGSATNFNELVGLYVKQTTEQLQQIREAVAQGEMSQAARVAHSCAGASATCGMNCIVPLLRRMEHLGQEGEAAEAAALLPAMDQEFERHKPIALAG
jgi:HPt (histidine-containing phosphotransfer) domain-containing protein